MTLIRSIIPLCVGMVGKVIHTCMCTYASHALMWRLKKDIKYAALPLCTSTQVLSLKLELRWSPASPRDPDVCLHTLHTDYRLTWLCLDLYVGAVDLILGPRDCATSTLTHWAIPSSPCCKFKLVENYWLKTKSWQRQDYEYKTASYHYH